MVRGGLSARRRPVFHMPSFVILLMCIAGTAHIFSLFLASSVSSDISFGPEGINSIEENEEEEKVEEVENVVGPLPLWFKGLTPELKKYAKNTIGETAEVKAKALSELRMLIKEKKNLFCREDDIFLLQFLRSQNFDVPRAFKVLNNYFDMRSKYKGLYTGRLPSELSKVVEMKAIVILPLRLPPGSQISLIQIGNLDLEQATADDFTAFLIVAGELLLECHASQICGYTAIVDAKNMKLQHYIQFLSTSYISLLITLLQECWPQKVEGIHFLNEPLAAHVLYKMFYPLLKPEFRDNIYFHGDNLTSLHQIIPQDYLPEELGGNMGPLDTTEFVSHFLSQESFVSMNNAYGLIDK